MLPNFDTKARIVAAIILLALFIQLLIVTATILRGLIYFLITTIKVFVIWPVWTVVQVLRVSMGIIKFILLVLLWAVCSIARGVVALFMLLGFLGSRNGQSETGGDGKVTRTTRQKANSIPVQGIGMADRRRQGWQFHVLLPGMIDRDGQNIAFIVGGMDGAEAWASHCTRKGWADGENHLAQRSTTAQGQNTRERSGHRS